MSLPGAFAQQRCGGVGSARFFDCVTENCEIESDNLKTRLTTHDMRAIEVIAPTLSGDVSVAAHASVLGEVRGEVLGYYSQEELEFILENIQDEVTDDHQELRAKLFLRVLQCRARIPLL